MQIDDVGEYPSFGSEGKYCAQRGLNEITFFVAPRFDLELLQTWETVQNAF
jgi:hypothetical protein